MGDFDRSVCNAVQCAAISKLPLIVDKIEI